MSASNSGTVDKPTAAEEDNITASPRSDTLNTSTSVAARDDDKSEAELTEWKQYQPKLSEQLALEKLRDAIQLRDRTMLEEAIDGCRTYKTQADNVKTAEVALKVLQATRELQQACQSKDIDAIKQQMSSIRHSDVASYLDVEMIGAKYLLESLQKRPRKPIVLDMDKNTMSEIRRYQNPPQDVHRVMQAVWLLLGEDEDTTDDWRTIQRLSNPQGHSGLRRKLLDFDASVVKPEMAAAAGVILDRVDIEKVKTCAAAFTFYVWAKGMCEEIASRDQQDVTPASRHRQKELLGRLPPPAPRMDRLYYKSLAIPHQQQHNKTSSSSRRTTSQHEQHHQQQSRDVDLSSPAGHTHTSRRQAHVEDS
jgi:hypothetical protein